MTGTSIQQPDILTPFAAAEVISIIQKVAKQPINPQSAPKSWSPALTPLYAAGILYFMVQGTYTTLHSLTSVTMLLDGLVAGIVDGISQNSQKEELAGKNAQTAPDQQHEVLRPEGIQAMGRSLQKANPGTFKTITNELKAVYEARRESLEQRDKALSSEIGMENSIIEERGLNGVSLANLLRHKALQKGDIFIERLLSFLNHFEAFLTATKVSILKQMITVGRFIGKELAVSKDILHSALDSVPIICEKLPQISSALEKASSTALGTYYIVSQIDKYAAWIATSLIVLPITTTLTVTNCVYRLATVSAIGFMDGLTVTTQPSQSSHNSIKTQQKNLNNYASQPTSTPAQPKADLSVFGEVKQIYKDYYQKYKNMDATLLANRSIADTIKEQPYLANMLSQAELKKVILTHSNQTIVNTVDRVAAAVDTVCALTVKAIYSGCKEFGKAVSIEQSKGCSNSWLEKLSTSNIARHSINF